MTMQKEVYKYYCRACEDKLAAGTSGNVSLYAPELGLMAITPSGLYWRDMSPDDVVLMTLDGAAAPGQPAPSSEWRLHAAVYARSPAARAIVHTHSKSAAAFAVCGRAIPEILIEMSVFLDGAVPVAPYAPPGTAELAEKTAEVLARHPACLMRSHGAVAWGESMEQAYLRACYVEDAADIYLRARLLGEPTEL